jgi:hypothetical protein
MLAIRTGIFLIAALSCIACSGVVESFTVNPHVKSSPSCRVKSSPSTGSFFVPVPASTERSLTKADLNELKTDLMTALDNKFFYVPVVTSVFTAAINAVAVYVVKNDAVDAATKKAQEVATQVATLVAKVESANIMSSAAFLLIIFFHSLLLPTRLETKLALRESSIGQILVWTLFGERGNKGKKSS